MNALPLSFRLAETADVEQIVALINSAYRGESSRQGWTTEADILAGRRTDVADIMRLLGKDDSMILLCWKATELLGSVHLQKADSHAHIGLLAVKPLQQGLGIGKRLLAEAESMAGLVWGVSKLVMAVIDCRPELIAYYQRRGYQRTGRSEPFPLNPALWSPKVAGLRLVMLEKSI